MTWQKLFKTVGKKRAKDARAQELSLVNSLHSAEVILQNHPSNPQFCEDVVIAKHGLRKLQTRKIQGVRIRSRLKWLNLGDRVSKFFFKALKVKEARDKITSICDDGKCFSESEGILEAFTQFYKNLFTSEDSRDAMKVARERIKTIIPRIVEVVDSLRLETPISLGEIKEAISSMGKEKAPGPDGISVQFFQLNAE